MRPMQRPYFEDMIPGTLKVDVNLEEVKGFAESQTKQAQPENFQIRYDLFNKVRDEAQHNNFDVQAAKHSIQTQCLKSERVPISIKEESTDDDFRQKYEGEEEDLQPSYFACTINEQG